MMRHLRLAAFLTALPAAAQAATWTVNVTGPIQLGTAVAGASGDTVFRIDASSGAVSVVSGAGRRLSTGSARIQIDVSCRPSRGMDSACATANVPMRVGIIGAVTGRARSFSRFNIAMGSASLVSGPTGGNPLDFTLAPVGANSVKTFFVGGDFPVAGDDSGLPSGLGENAFFVYALDPGGLSTAGDTDKGKVTAYRSLAIGKTADLSFGRIQIPSSGSSTVTLSASNGNRKISGNAVGYATPAPTRAAFTISGEGGQQVSLTVPSILQMTGPGVLSVNLDDTAPKTPNLSGGLGAAGTYSFHVGGSFTITPATPTGAYGGVLTVSVDYN